MKILIISGPNLSLLGKREPAVYGKRSLTDMERRLRKKFPKVRFKFVQTNHEGEIVDVLNDAQNGSFGGIVINPGAYTHYSYAIRDAIAALSTPVVEVHLSNVHAREEFRRHSVIAAVCRGVVAGFGVASYELAVRSLVEE